MDVRLLTAGLEVTVFGLAGVFSVLVLFYCATKLMLVCSKRFGMKKDEER